MDMTAFFNAVRPMFGGSLTQKQVDGCETLIGLYEQAAWPVEWAAYGLATAKWETAHTMQPIKEYGSDAYFTKMYDINGSRPDVAKALGNTQPGDGAKYCGRGYVQLTGRTNYTRAGPKVGADLVNYPDLALDPTIAGQVMIAGMSEGWFTGKKLADYLGNGKTDYVNARRIINGTDHANEIASIAKQFEAALRNAGYGQGAALSILPEPVPLPDAATAGFMAGFIAALKALSIGLANIFKGAS